MKAFELGKMTLSSIFKKPETYCYPHEVREPYEGSKGHVENNIAECIFCGACESCCPCDAITIDMDESAWVIDYFGCIQCGSCVRECPASCLSMAPGYPQVAAAKSKERFVQSE